MKKRVLSAILTFCLTLSLFLTGCEANFSIGKTYEPYTVTVENGDSLNIYLSDKENGLTREFEDNAQLSYEDEDGNETIRVIFSFYDKTMETLHSLLNYMTDISVSESDTLIKGETTPIYTISLKDNDENVAFISLAWINGSGTGLYIIHREKEDLDTLIDDMYISVDKSHEPADDGYKECYDYIREYIDYAETATNSVEPQIESKTEEESIIDNTSSTLKDIIDIESESLNESENDSYTNDSIYWCEPDSIYERVYESEYFIAYEDPEYRFYIKMNFGLSENYLDEESIAESEEYSFSIGDHQFDVSYYLKGGEYPYALYFIDVDGKNTIEIQDLDTEECKVDENGIKEILSHFFR